MGICLAVRFRLNDDDCDRLISTGSKKLKIAITHHSKYVQCPEHPAIPSQFQWLIPELDRRSDIF
jgi:hypothetical protein